MPEIIVDCGGSTCPDIAQFKEFLTVIERSESYFVAILI